MCTSKEVLAPCKKGVQYCLKRSSRRLRSSGVKKGLQQHMVTLMAIHNGPLVMANTRVQSPMLGFRVMPVFLEEKREP